MCLKTDTARLVTAVEARVNELALGREAFTTMDVSKPIIEASVKSDGPANRVRHYQVRDLVDQMSSRGEIVEGGADMQGDEDAIAYVVGSVTVYPEGGQKPITVRLFHPDDPTVDWSSNYTKTRQTLNAGPGDSSGNKIVTRGIDMSDVDDGDDSSKGTPGSTDRITILTATVDGSAITKQCQIQTVQGSLNIPLVIVRAAGFNPANGIAVSATSGNGIRIESATTGRQYVDKEGRIRLHGKNLDPIASSSGPFTAAVVEPTAGTKYIEIT